MSDHIIKYEIYKRVIPMMTEPYNPVVISSRKTNGLSETSTGQKGKSDALNRIASWAWNAIRILVESTPNELRYNGASRIIEDFRVLPIPESLGKEGISKIMDAQAKLLLFKINLASCLKGQIDEREFEHSRQSCLEALSGVIQITSS
jgi:hypothetical protein